MNRTKSIFVAASILLALAFTTSCSGDGGGGNEETPSSSSVGGAPTPSSSGGGISSGGGTSSGGGNSSSGGSSSSDGTSSIPKCGAATYDPETQLCDSRGDKLYKIKKISIQTWMAENLNHNADGSACYEDDPSNCAIYGRLYDWATAMGFEPECNEEECADQIDTPHHKGVCPSGWHIPSNAEWNLLYKLADSECYHEDIWGECPTAGAKLKAGSGWEDDGNGTDNFGFSALPGGYGYDSSFNDAGYYGSWWSSSESEDYSDYAYRRFMYNDEDFAYWNDYDKPTLFSVRCVKD